MASRPEVQGREVVDGRWRCVVQERRRPSSTTGFGPRGREVGRGRWEQKESKGGEQMAAGRREREGRGRARVGRRWAARPRAGGRGAGERRQKREREGDGRGGERWWPAGEGARGGEEGGERGVERRRKEVRSGRRREAHVVDGEQRRGRDERRGPESSTGAPGRGTGEELGAEGAGEGGRRRGVRGSSRRCRCVRRGGEE